MKTKLLILIAVATMLSCLNANRFLKAPNLTAQTKTSEVEIVYLNSPNDSDENDINDAYEYINNAINELLKGIDFSSVDKEFEGVSFLGGQTVRDNILNLVSGDYKIDYKDLFTLLLNEFWGELGNLSGYFAMIIAIAILWSISGAVSSGNRDFGVTQLFHFISLGCVIGVVAIVFGNVYLFTFDCVNNLERQSDAVLPVLLTIMTASGASVSASIYQPQVAFLTKAITSVVKRVLLPIVMLLFIFNCVGYLSDRFQLEKTKAFLKSAFKWITGITVLLFNFFVTAQGLTASVYDGISIKALKYALGNSVPLVGNLVSGGFDVVFASLILIKNAVGSFALIALVFTVISPIIKIAVFPLFLRFTAGVIEPIADKKLTGFLSGVADTSAYISTISMVGASSYFITLLLIICSLGGGV